MRGNEKAVCAAAMEKYRICSFVEEGSMEGGLLESLQRHIFSREGCKQGSSKFVRTSDSALVGPGAASGRR